MARIFHKMLLRGVTIKRVSIHEGVFMAMVLFGGNELKIVPDDSSFNLRGFWLTHHKKSLV